MQVSAKIRMRHRDQIEELIEFVTFRSQSSWSLRADPGQRLHLRFLDISLRERTSDSDLECVDSVEVTERGKRLMRMCGESQTDIRLLSERNVLEVEYSTDV